MKTIMKPTLRYFSIEQYFAPVDFVEFYPSVSPTKSWLSYGCNGDVSSPIYSWWEAFREITNRKREQKGIKVAGFRKRPRWIWLPGFQVFFFGRWFWTVATIITSFFFFDKKKGEESSIYHDFLPLFLLFFYVLAFFHVSFSFFFLPETTTI